MPTTAAASPATASQTGFDPTDKGFYHGGDLAGLTGKLDYIEGLGTTAIWLTPSFKNRPVQGTGPDASAGYHGYWITDFTQIDPHLGTNDELEALIDEAHARGMKVFFDIITNHTADVIDYAEKALRATSPRRPSPTATRTGNAVRRPRLRRRRDVPAARRGDSFPYTPVFRDAGATQTSRCRPGSTTRRSTTTAATRPSPARPASTATSSASTTCSPSTPRSSTA